MRVAFIGCSLILVLLAIPVTGALAHPPTPEATPSPAATATPVAQATGSITLGSFALDDLVKFATLAGIVIVAFLSGYTAYVLRPMQRREVELLERELECVEREKESLANVLREEKTYLDMQLRDAQAKANISPDLTLPSEPVSLDPKDRQILQEILSRLERIESVSIAAGAETLRSDPQEYISEGNLHYNLQQYEQAIQNYNKALELKPDFPKALYNRGIAYRYVGQYERAIQDYDKALELRPDYPEALVNRGLAYIHLGQYEQAIQDFNRAVELRADYATPRYNMACAYSVMNKPDEALKWLKEAIDLDEKCRNDAKSDSDFDNIRDDSRFKELIGE